MLNLIEYCGLGLETELVLEPNNRLWELRKIKLKEKNINSSIQSNLENSLLDWTCRLEDIFIEKFKRGGMWFNYWPGYLCKLRKIKLN